jgi:pilus assembly protein CpaC
MFSRFVIAVCAAWALLSPPAAFAADEKSQDIVMFVGEIKSIPANRVFRVAIGNGGLLTTKFIEPNQLLLIAEAVGDTSVVLWSPQGEIHRYTLRIGAKDSAFAYHAATEMLQDISGIQITPIGTNVAITGSASQSQIARISAVAQRYPQIMPLVRELDVEMKKMIYMKVQIMEAKKSFVQTLGVSWPGSFAGPVVGFSGNLGSANPVAAAAAGINLPLTVTGMRTFLGMATSIQSTINIAKSTGDLETLAEPELSARSGGQASFLAGGQIPIQTAGALGTANVSYKDYGIKLTLKPAADDKGNVIAGIRAELSQLDQSTSVNGVPGFLTRVAETEINVKSGQTMVISGLVNKDMQNDVSMIPGLGDLPILGALFRSKDFRADRTDLVIIVTPVVIDPSSTINQERVEKELGMRERLERNLSKRDILD